MAKQFNIKELHLFNLLNELIHSNIICAKIATLKVTISPEQQGMAIPVSSYLTNIILYIFNTIKKKIIIFYFIDYQ